LSAWQQADKLVSAALHRALDDTPWPTGPAVAGLMLDALPSSATLVVGSSNPTRHIALAACVRADVEVFRNRGVAGIDGTLSTAVGVSVARRSPAYALLGDLTFLHDVNALLIGQDEPRPDLTVVVINDDGGGIFGLLEQGDPRYAHGFERVFGTPHGADLAALCAGYRVPHTLATSPHELRSALGFAPGLRVVEVRVPRSGQRELHARLRAAVENLFA